MGDRDKVAEYKVLSLPLLTKTQSSQLTAEQPLTKKQTTKTKNWNIQKKILYPKTKETTMRWQEQYKHNKIKSHIHQVDAQAGN